MDSVATESGLNRSLSCLAHLVSFVARTRKFLSPFVDSSSHRNALCRRRSATDFDDELPSSLRVDPREMNRSEEPSTLDQSNGDGNERKEEG